MIRIQCSKNYFFSSLIPCSISSLISLDASLNSRIPLPRPLASSGIFLAPNNTIMIRKMTISSCIPKGPRNRNSDVSVSIVLYSQSRDSAAQPGFSAIPVFLNQLVNIRIKRQAGKNLDFYKKFFTEMVPFSPPRIPL